ncbi:DUF6527 family protein [uncultured Bosea sp.]|jgi:hypothetical protein|uniref:DUF6527 family protein n=1 Tax=uncultured Bosea sp. TaxID=211457 RepID=UPI0025DEB294|nr:DUF6527 family protein [uncultured Bosea sp.]
MKTPRKIRHEFVEFIPKDREAGVLYVSIPYATAVHDCFCGCGTKVVTPISPVGWQLTFDGESVSLAPSVGNWSFACRSHYFIRKDRVDWAGDMSDEAIAKGRTRDKAAREGHFGAPVSPPVPPKPPEPEIAKPKPRGFWSWLTGRR